eukprot:TRINITY_DN26615_c0_g1_i1.p1 TRINITY_DN26615_c0_g1~~TRINITY_DN26615_c0_g1_i1.p1  ORF type:complete len:429 (-),score=96.65 TRINITY_DN26615_c0_g1_i1:248-1366(-)
MHFSILAAILIASSQIHGRQDFSVAYDGVAYLTVSALNGTTFIPGQLIVAGNGSFTGGLPVAGPATLTTAYSSGSFTSGGGLTINGGLQVESGTAHFLTGATFEVVPPSFAAGIGGPVAVSGAISTSAGVQTPRGSLSAFFSRLAALESVIASQQATIQLQTAQIAAAVAVGSIVPSLDPVVPAGYLLCNGQPVLRSAYAALFAVIGTAYGAGDGGTTFNVPDLRGRATLGSGTGGGLSARSVGQTGGAERVTLLVDNLPAHAHPNTVATNPTHTHSSTGADGGHSHAQPDDSYLVRSSTSGSNTFKTSDVTVGEMMGLGDWSRNVDAHPGHTHPLSDDGSHTHTVTVGNTGSGLAVETVTPFAVAQYVIKF